MGEEEIKMIRLISTIIFLIFSCQAFACDCFDAGDFMTVAPKTEMIALVKVTKYLSYDNIYGNTTPISMEALIVDLYRGNETQKTIIVWGDNGALCRPYISQFSLGKYYLIAFYKGSDGKNVHTHKNEKTTDYIISNCGEYWLNVDSQLQYASGITDKQQELVTLKKKLKN